SSPRRWPDARDELQPNLHRLSRLLRNQKALLFTNRSLAAVSELLAGLTDADFARSGFAAVNSVELMPGACPQWQHSMEPALRKLGLPVRLSKVSSTWSGRIWSAGAASPRSSARC
ncbi:hypothetical protein BOX15_Mlig003157g2, partial [Macrostomum lignano]